MDENMKLELEREERQRRNRLKELEEMVQRLQSENKRLLNQVGGTSKPPIAKIEVTPPASSATKPAKLDEVEDIINLNSLEQDTSEDEWLYVSPVRPPTPQDKSVTPDQWLKSGERENRRSSLPGLDEVKKQLLCYAMDLELNSSSASSSKQQSLLSPDSSPKINLRRVQSLSNKTAQKYLEQVRTKRRSLDRADISTSPTKELGEDSQEDKFQQPVESLMKTYALNTSTDIHASPNTSNGNAALKPRNMPIRAIIPSGKISDNIHRQDEEAMPPDLLQRRATPPLDYAQKGPSQSPSPDYGESDQLYIANQSVLQVANLRKSPVFPRRVIQPVHVSSPPQQQRQQLPQSYISSSPRSGSLMPRQEPSASMRTPQGGSMISRLSPGRGGMVRPPAAARTSHAPGNYQQQVQHGNITQHMGKPLTRQASPQRGQLISPGHAQLPRGSYNHHQQRYPAHRNAIPQREVLAQQDASEEDSSWMEGCF